MTLNYKNLPLFTKHFVALIFLMAIVFLSSSIVTAQPQSEEVIATNADSKIERVPVQDLPLRLPRRILEFRLLGNFETTGTILYQSDSVIGHYIKVHITAYQPGVELSQYAQMSLDMLENQCERSTADREVVVPEPWKASLAFPVKETSSDCSTLFHARTEGYHVVIEIPRDENIDRVTTILSMFELLTPKQVDIHEELGINFELPEEFGTTWTDRSVLGGFSFKSDECGFQILKVEYSDEEFRESVEYFKTNKSRFKKFYSADALSANRYFYIDKCYSDEGESEVFCAGEGLILGAKGYVAFIISQCSEESMGSILEMFKGIEPLK